jgi:hypothetical protein
MATTDLYQTCIEADAAFHADDLNLDKLRVSDAAFAAYQMAIKAARAEWYALPGGDLKDSAETNAHDTEGTEIDELYWFEIAIRTYEMGIA